MVPFCDLLNHKKYPNVIWSYDKNEKTFNMITTSDIKAGEEILTKYGNKGNENEIGPIPFLFPFLYLILYFLLIYVFNKERV